MHDMAKVEKLMAEILKKEEPNKNGTDKIAGAVSATCKCCCHEHCKLSVHSVGGALQGVSLDERKEGDVNFPNIYDSAKISDFESEHIIA